MKIRGKQEQNEDRNIKSGRSKSQHINNYGITYQISTRDCQNEFLKMTKEYVVYK